MHHDLFAEEPGEVKIGALFPERHVGGGVKMNQADAAGGDDENIFDEVEQRVTKAEKAGPDIASERAGVSHRRGELGHGAAFGLGDIKMADGEPLPQGRFEQGVDEEFHTADLRRDRSDQEDLIVHGQLAVWNERAAKISKRRCDMQMETARPSVARDKA